MVIVRAGEERPPASQHLLKHCVVTHHQIVKFPGSPLDSGKHLSSCCLNPSFHSTYSTYILLCIAAIISGLGLNFSRSRSRRKDANKCTCREDLKQNLVELKLKAKRVTELYLGIRTLFPVSFILSHPKWVLRRPFVLWPAFRLTAPPPPPAPLNANPRIIPFRGRIKLNVQVLRSKSRFNLP